MESYGSRCRSKLHKYALLPLLSRELDPCLVEWRPHDLVVRCASRYIEDPWSLEGMAVGVVTLHAFPLVGQVVPERVGHYGSRLYDSCAAACQPNSRRDIATG